VLENVIGEIVEISNNRMGSLWLVSLMGHYLVKLELDYLPNLMAKGSLFMYIFTFDSSSLLDACFETIEHIEFR
jgi:hypothetical protein